MTQMVISILFVHFYVLRPVGGTATKLVLHIQGVKAMTTESSYQYIKELHTHSLTSCMNS